MNVTSVLMVGVGGQGIVLASNLLCKAVLLAGFDVKKSEIHGMAQRGGSVVSHVRFGKEVLSPVIPRGKADFIVSFERMEFLRYLEYASGCSRLVLNTRRILPPSVMYGNEPYPDEIIDSNLKLYSQVKSVDADGIAYREGNTKAASSVMLGVLAGMLGIETDIWAKVLKDGLPEKIVNVNLLAFDAGFKLN